MGTSSEDVFIDLVQCGEWQIVEGFVPGETFMEPGKIYFPKSLANPGWDFCICFCNEKKEICAAMFQSRDKDDPEKRKTVAKKDSTTIPPMKIGRSICNTIGEIQIIRLKNKSIPLTQFYYVLLSKKRAPNFTEWKTSVKSYLKKHQKGKKKKEKKMEEQNNEEKEEDFELKKKIEEFQKKDFQQKAEEGINTKLGGIFYVQRDECLCETLSSFITRPKETMKKMDGIDKDKRKRTEEKEDLSERKEKKRKQVIEKEETPKNIAILKKAAQKTKKTPAKKEEEEEREEELRKDVSEMTTEELKEEIWEKRGKLPKDQSNSSLKDTLKQIREIDSN